MDRAKNTSFTQRLGDQAYVFWNDAEIRSLLRKHDLKLVEILSLKYADFYIVEK